MDFIDAVANILERLDISQRKLAHMIGASNQWINFCMSRKYRFKKPHKIAIAHVLSEKLDAQISAYMDEVNYLKRLRIDLEEELQSDEP